MHMLLPPQVYTEVHSLAATAFRIPTHTYTASIADEKYVPATKMLVEWAYSNVIMGTAMGNADGRRQWATPGLQRVTCAAARYELSPLAAMAKLPPHPPARHHTGTSLPPQKVTS